MNDKLRCESGAQGEFNTAIDERLYAIYAKQPATSRWPAHRKYSWYWRRLSECNQVPIFNQGALMNNYAIITPRDLTFIYFGRIAVDGVKTVNLGDYDRKQVEG